MATKRQELNMTEGPFLKKIVWFSIPVMITGFLQTFYNAADLAIVGRFRGELALAAVGGNGSITTMIVGLFMGLSVAAGVMVAQQLGAKDEEAVKKTVHNAILLALVFGVLVGFVGWLLAPSLLKLVAIPDNVMDSAVLYLRIIFLGTPATMMYNYCSAMVRSTGDSKRPLIFLTVSGIVNVLLNLVFVAVFGMSVDGVALATIVSQYLSAGMILVYMMRSESCIRFRISDLRFDRKTVGRMMYIGLPSGLQSCAFALPNLMIHSSVNGFGEAAIAGNAAATSLENFIAILMNSFYHATLTFVGQNVGAKQYRNVKRVVWQTLGCCFVVGVVGCSLLWFFRDFFLGLYMSEGNAEVKAYAVKRFRTMFPLLFLCGFQETLTGALRGLGKSVMALVATLLGAFAFRIFWLQVIFPILPFYETVIVTFPLSYVLISVFCAVCLVVAYRNLIKKDVMIS